MLAFLISLIICITLHELGHLIVAKKCKCGVKVYSIGFGKPYLKYKYRRTEYRLTPWLFGGYCELQDELKNSRSRTAFTNLRFKKKLYITIAGCMVNIITGIIAGIIGHYTGIYNFIYFSCVSIMLGITNLLPIFPCLDGGYLVYYPLCVKFLGKYRGTKLFEKLVRISFQIVMILNILCIPWLIMNWNRF